MLTCCVIYVLVHLIFLRLGWKKKVKGASTDGFEASIDPSVQHDVRKFEKGCKDVSISKEWDASAVRESLLFDIEKTKSKTN
ncbi:hypothetical protein POPTR_012G117067v4 [Populus trichocarpa]|uniref:Cytochrome P450 n=1 Tax=Populus trichocarpa TaxID=3694 RepID=A0A2K1YCA8_POPTR|nr:hypothetical protein POPTR_012G117067v4 [Populus trichocarpa]